MLFLRPGSSTHALRSCSPGAARCAQVAQMQWQVFCLPYNMFLYCLSWIVALLLRFLVVAGAPPSEYANKAKVR